MPTIVVALPDEAPETIVLTPPAAQIVERAPPEIVTIVTGLQGPPGLTGATGPQGPAGSTTLVYYVHNQEVAAAVWTVIHNLGLFPSVTVVDTANQQVEGDLEYLTLNVLQVSFVSAFSGKAYLS